MRLKNMIFVKEPFLILVLISVIFSMSFAANGAERLQNKGFVLSDTTGKKHALSQYKGKWVIVNYWATWCPPCLEEVPDLVALYDSRKNKDVMLLGVAFDYQDAKEVADYVDDMLMSYPIVLGDDEVIKQIGTAEVMPTTYIYNPRGELVKTKRGLVTKVYLEDIIAKGSSKTH
ncbi:MULTISPECIES: TlpA disulfide reductase family protein [Methylotenera]|uniref:TlpA disulfide reductase family protein n=1 Tax=Methylotenera TaxID=359407 RepID=UPI00037B376B|nr:MULTISPECIES: TlpA disulfide reductase family protein [Methylotenera]